MDVKQMAGAARSAYTGTETGAGELLLRPAVPADAPEAVELIYLPMGKLANYLFGADKKERALEVLRGLFTLPENRFSYTYCDVLEEQGKIAGLVLAYPESILKKLELPMAKQLRAIIGLGGMIRLIKRSLRLRNLKEAEPGEYFILAFAIAPEFQRRGLGGRLLDHAEEKARAFGLAKTSLGVGVDNHDACRFYEAHGYRIVETIQAPSLEKAIGYPGYHRMVKNLSPRPAALGFAEHQVR